MKQPRVIKIKTGVTSCGPRCSYFSGSPSEHDCGKPIYSIGYKCPLCERIAHTETQIKQHLTIKHKKLSTLTKL